ncbi:uncharacterized protein RhoGEF3 isoform X2 [Prorops nasuta]|uniref:uncharacterized protein RhoGEF3 isoform X2 n=1 Tax=Prorops nasuta TaxID=863751 RepID=UPI0034CD146D
MNLRDDPLLRQHHARVLHLAETTNIKPGRGSSKRRGQRSSHGVPPSNGGPSARAILQDIVRSDPAYTANIEHLVFQERKGSNPNLVNTSDGSPKSKSKANAVQRRSKLAEMFATHCSRESTRDSAVTSKKNHLNSTSMDGGGSNVGQQGLRQQEAGSSGGERGKNRRWLSQGSQSSRQQHSATEEGGPGPRVPGVPSLASASVASTGSGPGQPSAAVLQRRLSPVADPAEIVSADSIGSHADRGPNVSILHLRGASDPWEVGSQSSAYSIGSNKSQSSIRGKTAGNSRGSYTRGSSIPSLKRPELTSTASVTSSLRQHKQHKQQDSHGQVSSLRRRDTGNSSISGNGGTTGDRYARGSCNRDLSPVRWGDGEVLGVYLNRSGWVQVQQRSLDDRRTSNYEPDVTNAPTTAGTLPLPRRVPVKLAEYHCSNSEPGNGPQDFSRLDGQRPDFLALRGQDYESMGGSHTYSYTKSRNIPESFSPPSITPIISPPPAFQDDQGRKSLPLRHTSRRDYSKCLMRTNAIDSDVTNLSSSPGQISWSSLPSSVRKSSNVIMNRQRRQALPNTQQQQYRAAQAKSVEDQSSSRRTQFAQRHIESSSSSSSSLGVRSLDSCVNRSTMPKLTENTDSSVEDNEDDHFGPSTQLDMLSSSLLALHSSSESIRANGDKTSPSNRQSRHHRSQQGLRRSPGTSESGSSSSVERQSRSITPNSLRSNNPGKQYQNSRNSPDSLQSRVRRSRSLQLPEKRSPGAAIPQALRDYPKDSNESHRSTVKHSGDRGNERFKLHQLPSRKAQSTDSTLDEEFRRETEAVAEYLYGTRRRIVKTSPIGRFDRQEDPQDQRRLNASSYDVYFISSKSNNGISMQQQQQQQSRRPRTLQRGITTPNANHHSSGSDFSINSDSKLRCNSSTCNYWPHCPQRDALYSPNQNPPVFMKLSQSYPDQQRLANDGNNYGGRGSTCSSPASLDRMDERELKDRENLRNGRSNGVALSKCQDRPPKGSAKTRNSRWSNMTESSSNGHVPGLDKRDQTPHRVYRKSDFANSFDSCDSKERKVSPVQSGKGVIDRSSSGFLLSSSVTSSSSSSSDIWTTTSDRTVTKSPKNPKGSVASTPMEDAVIGSFKTLMDSPEDGLLSRPGSAPTRGEDPPTSTISLDPHQRSLSLPKSFLAHNTPEGNKAGNWQQRGGRDSQRSSPSQSSSLSPSPSISPSGSPGPGHGHRHGYKYQYAYGQKKQGHKLARHRHPQDMATPHTAPVSPLHDKYSSTGHSSKERGRRTSTGLGGKSQRRIKASSTPALLDHDGRQWSGDEVLEGRKGRATTEHPLSEASIPLANHPRLQESIGGAPLANTGNQNRDSQQSQQKLLQKFRKSFSLRFHKKGSKESTDGAGGECPPEENDASGPLDEEDEHRNGPINDSHSSHSNKEDPGNEQKFRFGPLVWRSSKDRKKGSKAARNAKCNSGDSGIQIEMVSGGALTGGSGSGTIGGGDSSESHDTDVQDDTDSPPALRRRVADKSRPQSELINQILIDKFKADLQSRASRHQHVRRTNSDLSGQRLLQWDTRSGHVHNYKRMLSTPSPIKMRPPRLSPRHSSHDIVTLRSNVKGRSSRTNLRRSLSQPLGINQLSPLMRTKTAGIRVPGGNVLSEDEQDGRGGTSDDEMMSDSESSMASLTDRKKSFEQAMDEEIVILAEAVWDHVAMESEELAFRAGDVIDVLDTWDKDWWWGRCGGEHGWFPAAFVRLRVSQEDTVEDSLAAIAAGTSTNSQLRRRTSVSRLSNEQVRTSVVRELVQTERDFVKVLRDVSEGYIAECRRRPEMFSEEQIETIFINLEELLDFQSEFLKDLESRIDWSAPYKSCIGECFLNHRSGFRMYSEYCNSHPMATATLQELYQHNQYSKFFEACRLMRSLMEIPLDGYLLTPVQRICKYPLQLAELLKYTKPDHPDYQKVQEALEAMRGVAVLINERKRRMESLEKLAAWQLRVEAWEDFLVNP